MNLDLPAIVPEVPVADLDRALDYYENRLGFTIDWKSDELGMAGLSQGRCRLFLTDDVFRAARGNAAPVVLWLNLENKAEVDALGARWKDAGADLLSEPESKPWNLHEFFARDLDGNLFRVFYDFTLDL